MANTTYNIRIDSRVRKEADALYKNMGLSLSAAVNLFPYQYPIKKLIKNQVKIPIYDFYADFLSTLLLDIGITQSVIQRRLPIDEIISEPLGEPPADSEYHSFESWEQAKEWLNA